VPELFPVEVAAQKVHFGQTLLTGKADMVHVHDLGYPQIEGIRAPQKYCVDIIVEGAQVNGRGSSFNVQADHVESAGPMKGIHEIPQALSETGVVEIGIGPEKIHAHLNHEIEVIQPVDMETVLATQEGPDGLVDVLESLAGKPLDISIHIVPEFPGVENIAQFIQICPGQKTVEGELQVSQVGAIRTGVQDLEQELGFPEIDRVPLAPGLPVPHLPRKGDKHFRLPYVAQGQQGRHALRVLYEEKADVVLKMAVKAEAVPPGVRDEPRLHVRVPEIFTEIQIGHKTYAHHSLSLTEFNPVARATRLLPKHRVASYLLGPEKGLGKISHDHGVVKLAAEDI
jgi:hypothetical protein